MALFQLLCEFSGCRADDGIPGSGAELRNSPALVRQVRSVVCSQAEGKTAVSQALHLEFNHLKRVAEAGGPNGRKRAVPAFVELIAPQTPAERECVLEFGGTAREAADSFLPFDSASTTIATRSCSDLGAYCPSAVYGALPAKSVASFGADIEAVLVRARKGGDAIPAERIKAVLDDFIPRTNLFI